MRKREIASLILPALALASVQLSAQTNFVDVTSSVGLESYEGAPGIGAGVAAADYDDDGDVDLFVPNAEGFADQLYRNLGNGNYEEIAASVGLASTERSRSALWFDYDGDHRMDLVVAGDCRGMGELCPDGPSVIRLFHQTETGSFEEVTVAAGVYDDMGDHFNDETRSGIAAGDINNDGYLDLWVGMWKINVGGNDRGLPHLFLNNTDGTFSDITQASGTRISDRYWQPFMHDLSDDGYVDMFLNVDFVENYLWINEQDNTFVDEAASAGVDTSFNEMGLAAGDFDNDGDLEFYLTNIFMGAGHNRFYVNNSSPGNLEWEDISGAAGVEDTGWGWGTTALDANNDGLLDLTATNGWMGGTSNSGEDFIEDSSRLFLNNGTDPMTFTDVSDAVGINDEQWGSALIAYDYDLDGDQDLVQTTAERLPAEGTFLRLFENRLENQPGPHHYLIVRPRMPGPNHWAIGATVRIEVGSTTQMRPIHAGISFLAQEPAEAFFGLGSATVVDRVVVEFPDGSVAEEFDVAADQVIEILPGDPNEIFADGFESGDTTAWSATVP